MSKEAATRWLLPHSAAVSRSEYLSATDGATILMWDVMHGVELGCWRCGTGWTTMSGMPRTPEYVAAVFAPEIARPAGEA